METKDTDTTGAEIARAKLSELATSRSGIITILLGLILIYYFSTQIGGCIRENYIDNTLQTGQKAASEEIKNAQTQTKIADEASVNRQVEDTIRQQNIEPHRQSAKHRSRAAQIETENARLNYEKAKNSPDTVSSDINLLNDRLCTEYRELYELEHLDICAK